MVIFCHQEVNSPTDLEEADGCMGYGNVIVFDKKKDVLAGTSAPILKGQSLKETGICRNGQVQKRQMPVSFCADMSSAKSA